MSSIDIRTGVVIHPDKIRIRIFVVLEIIYRLNMPSIRIGVIRHPNKIRKQFHDSS